MIKLKEIVNKETHWYIGANPTADIVVLKNNKILLIKRNGKTEHGKWAIPGGFVNTNSPKGTEWKQDRETPKQVAIRELLEETELDVRKLNNLVKEIGVYEGNNREPRDTKQNWSQSHAFGMVLPQEFDASGVSAIDDASDIQ